MRNLIIKNIGDKALGTIRVCAEAVAYVLVVCATITGHLGSFVSASGYDVSYPVMSRLVFFGALISLIAVYVVIGYVREKPKLEWDNFSLVLVFSGFSLGSIYCIYNLIAGRAGHFGANVLAFAYIAFYIYGYSNFVSTFFARKIVRKSVIFGLVVAAIIFPLFSGKFVNLESYVEPTELNNLREKIHTKIHQTNSRLVIKLDGEAGATVEENIEKIAASKNKYVIGTYNFVKLTDTFIFDVNKNNLQPACLLGKYDFAEKKIGSLDLCLASFVGATEAPEMALKILIADVPFATKNIGIQVIRHVNQTYLNNVEFKNEDMLKARASVMLVRGAYFHHYNSIARSINEPAKISDLFSNQYGFGPLFLVKSVSVYLGLSSFDAIYATTLMANFLIFVFVFFLFRHWRSSEAIWLGFSVSILCTYFLSNMMAPFLYFIRYFPTVVLFFLLFSKSAVGNREASVGLKSWDFFFAVSLLAVSIYNFEYALLTALGLLIGGLLTRRFFYVGSGLASIFVAAVFKFLNLETSMIGTNYLSYISGAGIDGGLGFIVYLFIAAVIITLYIIIKAGVDFTRDGGAVVAALIFLMLCAKVAWIGSANHIGPLFLLLMILYSHVKSLQTENGFPYQLKINYCIFVLYSAVLVISVAVAGSFNYNTKLYGVNYQRNSMSLFYKFPIQLNAKLESVALVYKSGDLVLSPIDNAISLYLRSHVTAPYPDISTNINSPIDSTRVVAAYTDKMVGRVVVDKSVIDAPNLISSYSDVLVNALNLGYPARLYIENVAKFFDVYKSLLGNGFSKCQENEHFIVLCR